MYVQHIHIYTYIHTYQLEMKMLQVKQRIELLDNGLQDRCENVRKACLKMLCDRVRTHFSRPVCVCVCVCVYLCVKMFCDRVRTPFSWPVCVCVCACICVWGGVSTFGVFKIISCV